MGDSEYTAVPVFGSLNKLTVYRLRLKFMIFIINYFNFPGIRIIKLFFFLKKLNAFEIFT